jgi:hypothetical protein
LSADQHYISGVALEPHQGWIVMILTEIEARERWCPFARSYDIDGDQSQPVTINRRTNGQADPGTKCLGALCMAWRWHDAPGDRISTANQYSETGKITRLGKPSDRDNRLIDREWTLVEEDDEGYASYERAKLNRRGFYGLAGNVRDFATMYPAAPRGWDKVEA